MYVSLIIALSIGQPAQKFPSYEAGAAIAMTANKTLVTFVGIAPRSVQGVTVARASGLDGLPSRCIVVSRPTKGGHEWVETLPSNATDADIRRAAGLERQVQAISPVPFVLPTAERQAEPSVGGDSPWLPKERQDAIRRAWPKSVPMPKHLAFYAPTKWVQRSAVTDFPQQRLVNVLTIGTMRRPSREPYNVPGGLDGIDKAEWSSNTAAIRGTSFRHIDETVPSATAYGGQLRRINRAFADGATFFDLLLNRDGVAFELRAMVYKDGKPEPMVLFADSRQAPAGYQRVKSARCLKCHEDAGSVSYGDGNAPGGGGNFSFPLLTED